MAKIDTHFEAFLAERRQQHLSPAGEQLFRDAWTAFRRLPGSYRADGAAIGAMLNLDRHRGQKGRYRLARGLAQILTWLQAQRVIPRQSPKALRPRFYGMVFAPLPLADHRIARVLRAINDRGVRALAFLVYHTGLRAETFVRLPKGNVSLATRSLTVPGRKGQPDVVLRLSDPACAALRLWFRFRRPKALYLFHDATAMPLTLRYASRTLRAAGAAVGEPAIGFGNLQYAHLRLLAMQFSDINQALIESRILQPFKLAHLRLPERLFLINYSYETEPGNPSYNAQYELSMGKGKIQ